MEVMDDESLVGASSANASQMEEEQQQFGAEVEIAEPVITVPSSSTYSEKIFREEALIKYTNCKNKDDARVFIFQNQNISELNESNEVILPNACIVKLAHNKLTSAAINQLWAKFPSTWWLDMSHNNIAFLDCFFPLALGSLNLVGNPLSVTELKMLKRLHILKLKIVLLDDVNQNVAVTLCNQLPNAWVINNDYVTYGVRNPKEAHAASYQEGAPIAEESGGENELTVDATAGEEQQQQQQLRPQLTMRSGGLLALQATHFRSSYSTSGAGGEWRCVAPNERELNIMRAVQDIPIYDSLADAYKLDILVEDYLEEAFVFNAFARQMALTNNSSLKPPKLMPVIDIYGLLTIPHHVRLDLSVLLTASILFPLPPALLKETLTILLVKHASPQDIEALPELPLYMRTAVVSMIRRVTRRELEEVRVNSGRLVDKPPREAISLSEHELAHHRATPTFMGSTGFSFIRPIKAYLAWPIADRCDDSPLTSFTELELDILKKLPDIPTAAMGSQYLAAQGAGQSSTLSGSKGSAAESYKNWVSFACRHTVLLFNKAPSCPPLMRPQTSAGAQDLYFQLLPLLQASEMTYDDLDISFAGVNHDGRILSNKAALCGRGREKPRLTPDAAATGAYVNIATTSVGDGGATKARQSLEESSKQLGGKFLPFGVGLPSGSHKHLLWNDETLPISRNYEKQWNAHLMPEDAAAAAADQSFFVTTASAEVERGPTHRNHQPRLPSPTLIKRDRLYSTTEINTAKEFTIRVERPAQPLSYPHTTATDLLTKAELHAPVTFSPKQARSPHKRLSPDRHPTGAAATGADVSFETFVQEEVALSAENNEFLARDTAALPEQEFNDSISVAPSIVVSIQMPTTPGVKAVDSLDSPMSADALRVEAEAGAPGELRRTLSNGSFNLEHDDMSMNDSVASGMVSGQLTPDGSRPHSSMPPMSLRAENSVHSLDTASVAITVPSVSLDINLSAVSNDPLDSLLEGSRLLPSSLVHHHGSDTVNRAGIAAAGSTAGAVGSGKAGFTTFVPARITGYSADAKWSSSFILAPPQAVQQYNTLKVITNDELNCWENLEFAPVVVTEPVQRIPISVVQASMQQQQQQLTMQIHQRQQQQQQLPPESGVPSPITIGTGTPAHTVLGGSSRGQPVSFLSPPRRAATPTKVRPMRTLSEEIKAEEANLLRDMGTVKNVFDITESQKPRLPKAQPHPKSLEEGSTASLETLESVPKHFKEAEHVSKLLLHTYKYGQQLEEERELRALRKRNKAVRIDDDVFLTGVDTMEWMDQEEEEGREGDPFGETNKGPKPRDHVAELAQTYRDIEALRHTVSSLDVLKVRHKYGNIYTNTGNTEFATVTEGGKQLGDNWYPCVPKSVYRLKASQSVEGLIPPVAKGKAGAPGNSRGHLRKGDRGLHRAQTLAPIPGVLFQNSVLTKVPYYSADRLRSPDHPDPSNPMSHATHRKSNHNDWVDLCNHNLAVLSKSCNFLRPDRLQPLEYNDDIPDMPSQLKPGTPAGSTLLSIAQEVSAEFLQSQASGESRSVPEQLRPPPLLKMGSSFNESYANNGSKSGRIFSPASIVMSTVRNDLFVPPKTPTLLKASPTFPDGVDPTAGVSNIQIPGVKRTLKRPNSSSGRHSLGTKPGSPKPSSPMNRSYSSASLALSVHSHKKKISPSLTPGPGTGHNTGHTTPVKSAGAGAGRPDKQVSPPPPVFPSDGVLRVNIPVIESASNTVDNDGQSAMETGAIYEAYSSRISATNWDDASSVNSSILLSPTANRGMQHANSFRVIGLNPPTGLITNSTIHRETMALPNYGLEKVKRKVDTRHRSQQLVGHTESPWVGRNHYKAATHSLSLSRTFQVSVKPKPLLEGDGGSGETGAGVGFPLGK